jgi:hypothetical protein
LITTHAPCATWGLTARSSHRADQVSRLEPQRTTVVSLAHLQINQCPERILRQSKEAVSYTKRRGVASRTEKSCYTGRSANKTTDMAPDCLPTLTNVISYASAIIRLIGTTSCSANDEAPSSNVNRLLNKPESSTLVAKDGVASNATATSPPRIALTGSPQG